MARRARREIRSTRDFYSNALSRAERIRYSRAQEVEGIDEEIALLRMKLSLLLEEHPDKVDLLFKGVNLLLKAVVAPVVVVVSTPISVVTSVASQGHSGSGNQQKRQSVNCEMFHGFSPLCCCHGYKITTGELNEG